MEQCKANPGPTSLNGNNQEAPEKNEKDEGEEDYDMLSNQHFPFSLTTITTEAVSSPQGFHKPNIPPEILAAMEQCKANPGPTSPKAGMWKEREKKRIDIYLFI